MPGSAQLRLVPVLQITATQTSRLSLSRRPCLLAWPARRADDAAQPTFLERRRKEDLSSSFKEWV